MTPTNTDVCTSPASKSGVMKTETLKRRRPIEAIEERNRRSTECEQRVRKALTKLTRAGIPFTVENVCQIAGVGKTFIYDKRRPELTQAVLCARDASQAAVMTHAEHNVNEQTASWRERALNAEALGKQLRAALRQRDARIADLTGQLYDPDGTHLAEENARLRDLIVGLNANLQQTQLDNNNLRRSLEAARANVKRERERNVSLIGYSDRSRQAAGTVTGLAPTTGRTESDSVVKAQ